MKRPVLRWFGGKYRLASWVIDQFPDHRVYTEPFGGAASVLMRKDRVYAEVWNDLDDSAFNLFTVLRSELRAAELQRLIEHTPYSRREFELAHVHHPYPVESARRLVVRSFMGFGADSCSNLESKTGFRSNSNRSNTTPAMDWVNYPSALPAFTERLKGVIIEHREAIEVMRAHDGPATLHYLDPPYPHTTRRANRYTHEMDEDDHRLLAIAAMEMQGKVAISGYEHPIYDGLGWRKVTKAALVDGAAKRLECLWMNY